jgi:hypothetical protein
MTAAIGDEDALRVLALGEITSNMRELFVVTVEWEDP